MQKCFLKNIYTGLLILMLFIPVLTPVFAQNSLTPCEGVNIGGGKECTFADLVKLAQAVAAKLFILGLALAPIIFAYAGYLLLSSQDNPGKRTTAKKIFWNVVLGLVVMMGAWVFVNLILTALLCGNITSASWFPFAVAGGGGAACPTTP